LRLQRPLASHRGALLALLLVLAGCASAPAARSTADLVNPHLAPDLAPWLAGPVSHLATAAEVQQYLALTDDAVARAFIDAFWAARAGMPLPPDEASPLRPRSLRERFEERAREADHLYAEAGYLGRRTDRGVIYVLYGKPASVDFDIDPQSGPPIERWTYAADAPIGLDGKHPDPLYSFRKKGDLTVLYRVPVSRAVPAPPAFP
jgi:GWxTD domain-containing protein